MNYVNPEVGAHAIAKIFCENRYASILKDGAEECCKRETGDPDVFAARKMAEMYGQIYQEAYRQIAEDNQGFSEFYDQGSEE